MFNTQCLPYLKPPCLDPQTFAGSYFSLVTCLLHKVCQYFEKHLRNLMYYYNIMISRRVMVSTFFVFDLNSSSSVISFVTSFSFELIRAFLKPLKDLSILGWYLPAGAEWDVKVITSLHLAHYRLCWVGCFWRVDTLCRFILNVKNWMPKLSGWQSVEASEAALQDAEGPLRRWCRCHYRVFRWLCKNPPTSQWKSFSGNLSQRKASMILK